MATRIPKPPWSREECLACILHARPGLSPGEALEMIRRDRTQAFVETYARLATNGDPLKSLKQELNERVSSLAQGLEPRGYGGALALMAAANGVDWGMRDYTYRVEDLVDPSGVKWIPSRGAAAGMLRDARRVAVVLDNAGEAVVDLIVARWLEERGHKVTLVAREEPYEVDVTRGEAEDLAGRHGISLEIVSTGNRYPAFHHKASTEARKLLASVDLILSKGIANYEAATEAGDTLILEKTIFLLRAKCHPIARQHKAAMSIPLVLAPQQHDTKIYQQPNLIGGKPFLHHPPPTT